MSPPRSSLRWWSAICLLAVLAGAPVWAGRAASGQQSPRPCSLADDTLQPDQPLELNHEQSEDLVKTLVMEKEVFVCRDLERGRITQVRDVETFIEIVERRRGRKVRPVERSVQVAACTKDFLAGTVTCDMSDQDREIESLGAGTSQPRIDLRTCRPHDAPELHPRDPVEMETVFVTPLIAKTTKVEKEVLDCAGEVADLYLFTDIVETRRTLSVQPLVRTMRPSSSSFFGIVCMKENPATELGTVETNRCYAFVPARPTAIPR